MTDDGADGRSRDHWTMMSPTLATYSLSPCTAKPFRVSRMDCRWCLRRNAGCPTLRPFRLPDRESNQFR